MAGIFLDSSVLRNAQREEAIKFDVQHNRIKFEFPDGFAQLRLIEECRALNALDVSDADNFDLIYDITMQMLSGKPVKIYFIDDNDKDNEIANFLVTNRYMDLRGVEIISEYPVLVNWLVEWIAGYLGKKFPRSLKSIQATMTERKERMKSLKTEQKVEIRMSSL